MILEPDLTPGQPAVAFAWMSQEVWRTVSQIVIDVGARLARREGIDVHLPPKAFDLLVLLVKNQPNAVSHGQLHAALWPGVHGSETSLAALVTQLRKALGDTSDDGRMIRTLHRVGYAFIGDAAVAGHMPTAGAPVCRLIWRGESIELPAGLSVVGRDRGCVVHIDAESISRQHARLNVTSHEVSLEDLGSKNGTWVAAERISGRVVLTDGVSFRLGSETVRFEIGIDERPTKTAILRFFGAVERDPAIDAWMKKQASELGAIARRWFDVMRDCGDDVRELMHDGCPVACVADAPFGYVNAFTTHVNVGFFHGAALQDPGGLMEGTGMRMRHVKLRPGVVVDSSTLSRLIDEAYSDIKARLEAG
jgi:DNA-binding winged helix-turn-helix (wHTH) protein